MQHGVNASVSSIVTQVEVRADDPGFANPTKPVGRFFSREDADRMTRDQGWVFVEDAGRGYRRVVPSPVPVRILDLPAIEALLAANVIPIAAGGGGVPVVRDASGVLQGVSAVIDKDLTSALLATDLRRRHAGHADRRGPGIARLRPADAATARHDDGRAGAASPGGRPVSGRQHGSQDRGGIALSGRAAEKKW